MEAIKELLHILKKNKVKHIEVLGNSGEGHTLVEQFYELILDGTLTSDEEASRYFYGEAPVSRKYRDLKRRLTEKIKNTLLFIDVAQPRYDNTARAYYTLWKDFAVSKVLEGKGGNKSFISLLEGILKDSQRFEFTELSLSIVRSLRFKYGTVFFDKKKFKYYDDLCLKLEQLNSRELYAERLFSKILLENHHAKEEERLEIFEKSKKASKELKTIIGYKSTYKLNLYYFTILLIGSKIVGDHIRSEFICKDAISFFESNPFYSNNATGIFMRQLFLLYWQQQKYEEGEALLKEAQQYTRDGDLSFFTNHAYYFLLCVHAEEYEKAHEVYTYATNHNRFNNLSAYHKERWVLYQAYLAYLNGFGLIPAMELTTFRINKFLNEVPIYSKDKSGTNIPILIIQTLLLLLYHRYNDVIDRMEALEKYAQRYLRQPATLRSYYFIKMVLVIPLADFHQEGSRRKAMPFTKKLEATPLNVTRQGDLVEIIPYERLWALALESLENKFWNTRTGRSSR